MWPMLNYGKIFMSWLHEFVASCCRLMYAYVLRSESVNLDNVVSVYAYDLMSNGFFMENILYLIHLVYGNVDKLSAICNKNKQINKYFK